MQKLPFASVFASPEAAVLQTTLFDNSDKALKVARNASPTLAPSPLLDGPARELFLKECSPDFLQHVHDRLTSPALSESSYLSDSSHSDDLDLATDAIEFFADCPPPFGHESTVLGLHPFTPLEDIIPDTPCESVTSPHTTISTCSASLSSLVASPSEPCLFQAVHADHYFEHSLDESIHTLNSLDLQPASAPSSPIMPYPAEPLADTCIYSLPDSPVACGSHEDRKTRKRALSRPYPPAHLKRDSPSSEPEASVLRPFRCKDCDKTFLRKQDLRRHEIVHDPNCPGYKCSRCGTTFTRSDALFRHVKTKRCF